MNDLCASHLMNKPCPRCEVADLERRLREAEARVQQAELRLKMTEDYTLTQLEESRDEARRWAKRWKRAAKEFGAHNDGCPWCLRERDAARAALRKLAEAADKLAQRSNGVTCGPRHQNTMTTGLMRLYNAQMAVEEALADPVVVAALQEKPPT